MSMKSTSNTSAETTNLQSAETKPCLVKANEAEQGFSVSYKGKFLYSKYNPKKAILNLIESLEVLDGTAFLCFSPVLGYGVEELAEKIGDAAFGGICGGDGNAPGGSSAIFLIEKDRELFEVMKSHIPASKPQVILLTSEECDLLPNYLWSSESITKSGQKIPAPGTFRRVVALNMSAGTQFFSSDYEEIFKNCQNVISTFWKNRITLVKLGRLFSKNIFKNLPLMAESERIENYFGKVGSEERPIFVLGAGPSLNETLETLVGRKSTVGNAGSVESTVGRPVIVAVDAALPVLKSYGVKPDFVVTLESQLAIEKCFIGMMGSPRGEKSTVAGDFLSDAVFLSDLTSRPQLNRRFLKFGRLAFFSTAYTDAIFYQNLKKEGLLPYQLAALGSVGSSAVALALKMRKNENVKVFVSGLDFSYNLDGTHAKGSAQQKAKLMKWCRASTGSTGSATVMTAASVGSVSLGGGRFTDQSLLGYAENFKNEFSGVKNLFNVGIGGLDLGIDRSVILNSVQNPLKAEIPVILKQVQDDVVRDDNDLLKKITAYLETERDALTEIKEILTGKTALEGDDAAAKLSALIRPREYLYLHFPDGHKCDVKNISFLKRIRSEIDWVLKIL